jgi:hypothetical protein
LFKEADEISDASLDSASLHARGRLQNNDAG